MRCTWVVHHTWSSSPSLGAYLETPPPRGNKKVSPQAGGRAERPQRALPFFPFAPRVSALRAQDPESRHCLRLGHSVWLLALSAPSSLSLPSCLFLAGPSGSLAGPLPTSLTLLGPPARSPHRKLRGPSSLPLAPACAARGAVTRAQQVERSAGCGGRGPGLHLAGPE